MGVNGPSVLFGWKALPAGMYADCIVRRVVQHRLERCTSNGICGPHQRVCCQYCNGLLFSKSKSVQASNNFLPGSVILSSPSRLMNDLKSEVVRLLEQNV